MYVVEVLVCLYIGSEDPDPDIVQGRGAVGGKRSAVED